MTDNRFTDDTKVNDQISAVADSTTSSKFKGVWFFQDKNCGTGILYIKRGKERKADNKYTSWNDKISSFKLSKDGKAPSCS